MALRPRLIFPWPFTQVPEYLRIARFEANCIRHFFPCSLGRSPFVFLHSVILSFLLRLEKCDSGFEHERTGRQIHAGPVAPTLHRDPYMTKHVTKASGRRLVPLALMIGLAGTIGAGLLIPARIGSAQERPQAPGPTTMVHLSQYGSEHHAVIMALQAARAVQKAGGSVTLLLDVNGVRLADARVPLEASRHGSSDMNVRELYDAFVKAGGQILVCAHCAALAGIDAANLRPGARMARGEDVGKAIQSSNQIIDY